MCAKNKDGLPKIPFSELKKHNAHDDAWMSIHGIVYNITEWSKKHPGGDIILLGAGTDSTILYESYHPQGVSSQILAKYAIGELEGAPESYYDWSGDFYPTVRSRVAEYFVKNKTSFRGGLIPKALLILSCFTLGFLWMLVGSWDAYLGAVLFGLASTHIGLGIMHDGNHGAFSSSPWINKIAGWGMDLIGASGLTWEYQHVVGHHQFTNLQTDPTKGSQNELENDPDTFSSYPLIRMHELNKRIWYNQWQHMYAPLLFGLMTLSKVFLSDIDAVVINKKIGQISMNGRLSNPLYMIRFVTMKVLTLGTFLGLPIYVHGFTKGTSLFLLAHFICSFYLGICFIVNHISEGCSFFINGQDPQATLKQDAQLKLQKASTRKSPPAKDWAALQVRACVNWCSGSWFWNHFSGGLNHQVEHHLFPSVAHIHYPAISKIVQEACLEFGVPYLDHPTFKAAYDDMIAHLRYLGTTD